MINRIELFSGKHQLWKFEGTLLKTRIYLPKGWWTFKFRDDLIYIEKDSNKVLATGNGVKIIEEDYKEGKHEQLWKIGEANTEGYFTLENYKVPKLLTATVDEYSLRIEGNFQLNSI